MASKVTPSLPGAPSFFLASAALKAMGVDPFERLAINPRRPRIRATTAIGFKQDVLATDLVPKGVEAEGWFSLSFRLQRGLQLLNRFRRRS
jgi:hypothetical protein